MPADPTSGLIVAEPAARYRVRLPLVADCSVLAAVLFDEPARDEAAEALAGRELCAPDLIDHELANVAVKKTGHLPEQAIAQAFTDLAQLKLVRHRAQPLSQWRLAVQFGLSAYDAAYLALAADLKAPLLTFDRRLGEAARRALG